MPVKLTDKDFFTTDEAAELLNISRRTLLGLVATGKLGGYKLNPSIIRIPREAIQVLLDRSMIKMKDQGEDDYE